MLPEHDAILLLYCPCPSQAEALRLGRLLVERKLAACANIVPSLTSVFVWDGQITETTEVLLLAKTRRACEAAAIALVTQEHPYTQPVILALPATGGPDVAAWIRDSTDGTAS